VILYRTRTLSFRCYVNGMPCYTPTKYKAYTILYLSASLAAAIAVREEGEG
jgi:hypothetical protein